MNRKNRTWLAVVGPLLLGVTAALVFLAFYLHKNKAVVTIRNRSGLDLQGAQLSITSLPKEQEVGEIKAGDSAKVVFENFGDGEYVFAGQFKDGKSMQGSGGRLSSG